VSALAWWRTHQPGVDAALEAALPRPSEAPERLRDAMRHLLFPGGKRLRPALALAGAEAVGGPVERAIPMAVAVELVHTYSLIHDDLPCMDDDTERRGRPTVHVAFDEATAVLAGDALLTAAFQTLAAAKAEPTRQLGAVSELARAAGAAGLVGGQQDDLGASELDATGVESVHARKSAALIAASVAGGACLAGAAEDTLAALRRFGTRLGVAFQIADDLQDADDDEGCSLVAVLGADAARERAEALLEDALSALPFLPGGALPLRELAVYAVRRSA
jgi:geranylgeranyl pyrophosphate synthase